MAWLFEQRQQSRRFHQVPRVHHAHPVRHVGHHPHVVRDQQDRRLGVPAQFLQPFQYLRLQRYINAGRDLVCDQQPGAHDHSHRQHHPLALSAAQRERVRGHHAPGIRHPQLPHHLLAHRSCRPSVQLRMGDNHLGQLRSDGLHRVERRLRVLEHQGHRLAPEFPHVFLGGAHQVNPVKQHPPPGDLAVVR